MGKALVGRLCIGVRISKSWGNRDTIRHNRSWANQAFHCSCGLQHTRCSVQRHWTTLRGAGGVGKNRPPRTATDYHKRKKIANGEQASCGKFGQVLDTDFRLAPTCAIVQTWHSPGRRTRYWKLHRRRNKLRWERNACWGIGRDAKPP